MTEWRCKFRLQNLYFLSRGHWCVRVSSYCSGIYMRLLNHGELEISPCGSLMGISKCYKSVLPQGQFNIPRLILMVSSAFHNHAITEQRVRFCFLCFWSFLFCFINVCQLPFSSPSTPLSCLVGGWHRRRSTALGVRLQNLHQPLSNLLTWVISFQWPSIILSVRWGQ